MTAKQKKLFCIASMMSVFVMAVTILVSGGKLNFSPLGVRGTHSEPVEGSITWSYSNSERTQHAYNRYSFFRRTQRGTGIYLYTFGAGSPNTKRVWTSKDDGSTNHGVFISAEIGTTNLFEFQSITSVSFVTTKESDNGGQFNIFGGGTDTTVLSTKTISSPGETITFVPSSQMTYLSVNTTNNKWVEFESITVNYTCYPGGAPTKTVSSISVGGQKTEFAIGDSFAFGGTVTAIYDDESQEDVTSSATFSGYNMLSLGEQTVTVTYSTISTTYTIEIVPGVLDSITLSGQTTSYNINDPFAFDGTVTAIFENGYEKTVTPTSISTPDMTTAGEKTVTVSYTESGITKSANYTITVTTQPVGPFVFSGTYNYASRGLTVTGNTSTDTVKDWTGCMTIEFKNDGTCVWSNNYKPTGLLYTFRCVVNFTYVATFNGTNSTIVLTKTSYYFERSINGGAYEVYDSAYAWNYSTSNYDRPINAGYAASATNDTGVLSADRGTLSISTYERKTNPEKFVIYDTLTFSLGS